MLIRTQLARPDGQVVDADTYNQLFTTHGVRMIFLVVPVGASPRDAGDGVRGDTRFLDRFRHRRDLPRRVLRLDPGTEPRPKP